MASQLTLGAWAPPLRPELSQYHTPDWLARRMVEWAEVRFGMNCLEPSAGGGAIEFDPAWCEVLRHDFPTASVRQEDFLATDRAVLAGAYDLAVMNPPLNGGEGPVHVARALVWARRVVSLLRVDDLHGVDNHRILWSRCRLDGEARLVRRPEFGGDHTARTNFVVVDIRRPDAGQVYPRIEWWD